MVVPQLPSDPPQRRLLVLRDITLRTDHSHQRGHGEVTLFVVVLDGREWIQRDFAVGGELQVFSTQHLAQILVTSTDLDYVHVSAERHVRQNQVCYKERLSRSALGGDQRVV